MVTFLLHLLSFAPSNCSWPPASFTKPIKSHVTLSLHLFLLSFFLSFFLSSSLPLFLPSLSFNLFGLSFIISTFHTLQASDATCDFAVWISVVGDWSGKCFFLSFSPILPCLSSIPLDKVTVVHCTLQEMPVSFMCFVTSRAFFLSLSVSCPPQANLRSASVSVIWNMYSTINFKCISCLCHRKMKHKNVPPLSLEVHRATLRFHWFKRHLKFNSLALSLRHMRESFHIKRLFSYAPASASHLSSLFSSKLLTTTFILFVSFISSCLSFLLLPDGWRKKRKTIPALAVISTQRRYRDTRKVKWFESENDLNFVNCISFGSRKILILFNIWSHFYPPSPNRYVQSFVFFFFFFSSSSPFHVPIVRRASCNDRSMWTLKSCNMQVASHVNIMKCVFPATLHLPLFHLFQLAAAQTQLLFFSLQESLFVSLFLTPPSLIFAISPSSSPSRRLIAPWVSSSHPFLFILTPCISSCYSLTELSLHATVSFHSTSDLLLPLLSLSLLSRRMNASTNTQLQENTACTRSLYTEQGDLVKCNNNKFQLQIHLYATREEVHKATHSMPQSPPPSAPSLESANDHCSGEQEDTDDKLNTQQQETERKKNNYNINCDEEISREQVNHSLDTCLSQTCTYCVQQHESKLDEQIDHSSSSVSPSLSSSSSSSSLKYLHHGRPDLYKILSSVKSSSSSSSSSTNNHPSSQPLHTIGVFVCGQSSVRKSVKKTIKRVNLEQRAKRFVYHSESFC